MLRIYLQPVLKFREEPSVSWDLFSYFSSANSSNGTPCETLAVDCGTGGSKLYARSDKNLFPWFSCVLWLGQYLIPYMPFPSHNTVAWAGRPLWTGRSENIQFTKNTMVLKVCIRESTSIFQFPITCQELFLERKHVIWPSSHDFVQICSRSGFQKLGPQDSVRNAF